jgi:rare lipoprotein A
VTRATVGALLAVAGLAAGCAAHRDERAGASTPVASAPAVEATAVINPPRSARGNPPFYDVLGRRYHVLDSSEGFIEEGVASWYGPDFHSRPTSSGEMYDMYAMTAAHKTLPLPTWVEVTNVVNGRRVIVKVNDRGPFVGERIIDLSFSAAEALDMVRDGTAQVVVRALGVPPAALAASVPGSVSEPAPAAVEPEVVAAAVAAAPPRPLSTESPSPAALPEKMFIQVGAFSDRGNASRLVDRLRDGGFANAFIATGVGAGALHRVRVGPLADANEFDRVNDRLRRLGVGASRLVVDY